MEVWGGIECTINRVGDRYYDQFSYDQLYDRPELLQEIVALGVKTLRFPILWEKNMADEKQSPSWAVEEHLKLLHSNNINVIAGLVHHGSGPNYAQIHQSCFPEKLAEYAKLVAQKFPWINDYTPINEPLTTARFCGLYGIWYPHQNDSSLFLQILINECKATVLAMEAIRTINPKARLIFTEDLTQIQGTKELQEQIDFENLRRWLSIDLICGKVDERHPLWGYLLSQNVGREQLEFFVQNPTKPDILGFNYYVTSERYLDHKLEDHAPHTHGGNGKTAYADIEAVRHKDASMIGISSLLTQAYDRYRLPMAVTEAQLCCGREDQLRWLSAIWNSCVELNQLDIPVMAVTFWSLFGAHGWDALLTKEKGNYELGAFDLSSGSPRPTAVAGFISSLADVRPREHPLLKGAGWWQSQKASKNKDRPVLLTGGTGTLGNAFKKICADRNIPFIAPKRNKLDITDPTSINNAIKRYRPWAIINAAGYVNVDAAELEVEACLIANTIGPVHLANACQKHGIQLLTFSSDLVFDGESPTNYNESHQPRPLNIYGHSKAQAERNILNAYPLALIIRTSAFFGPWDNYNFVSAVLDSLKKGMRFSAMSDVEITATYVPHLVHTSLDLLIDKEKGIWHLSNIGKLTWYDLAVKVAERAGCDVKLINRISQAELSLPAQRPYNSALESIKGKLMPHVEKGLDEYFGFFNPASKF